ncbi:hypothetical protein ACMGE7_02340 [Macrococcus equi]|uniref:hypothetical protein n=1 Tax=Macrococcus equi TaxID=3395462 RepID=UPI0039BE1350
MYVKKATKKTYYKELIIIFTLLMVIEILDHIILNEPIHYDFLIFYFGGVCLGTWIKYNNNKDKMNDQGELVVEDEFTIKLKYEFDHKFLIFITTILILGYYILKWCRVEAVNIHVFAWILPIMIIIYYISRYIFISERTE